MSEKGKNPQSDVNKEDNSASGISPTTIDWGWQRWC